MKKIDSSSGSWTAAILKAAFIMLFGLGVCIVTTGIIVAVALGSKGDPGRSRRRD